MGIAVVMTHTHRFSWLDERMGREPAWSNMGRKGMEQAALMVPELSVNGRHNYATTLVNTWLAAYGANKREELGWIYLDFPSKDEYVAWCLAWS